MTDAPDPGLLWARHLAQRDGAPDVGALDQAARDIVRRLGEGALAAGDQLDQTMGAFFGRFGYHAGCDAIEVALERLTEGNPGRPPKAVTDARRRLQPFMRGRGQRRQQRDGRHPTEFDRLAARDDLWRAIAERLGANRETVARHIHERENPGRLSLRYIRTRLRSVPPRPPGEDTERR